MNTFIQDHYVFQYCATSNGSFNMTVINRLLCEEYTVCIDKSSSSFYNGHPIIQNEIILVNVIKDGFDKKNNVSIVLDTCDCDRLNGTRSVQNKCMCRCDLC